VRATSQTPRAHGFTLKRLGSARYGWLPTPSAFASVTCLASAIQGGAGERNLRVAVRRAIGQGVAGRLSAYMRVLTQAKKLGREQISSEEISAYTRINASQIRRDLSVLGKLGRRGVGYRVDQLLGLIGEVLFSERKHRIALVGAGRLGEAIASSPIFTEQGMTLAAIFDQDPAKVGRRLGGVVVSDCSQLGEIVRRNKIVVGVLAVPAASAQQAASDLVEAGVTIIFNYSEALLELPPQVQVLTSNPAAQLVAALSLLG
jgi:redox-sensing transcriptional repressor